MQQTEHSCASLFEKMLTSYFSCQLEFMQKNKRITCSTTHFTQTFLMNLGKLKVLYKGNFCTPLPVHHIPSKRSVPFSNVFDSNVLLRTCRVFFPHKQFHTSPWNRVERGIAGPFKRKTPNDEVRS